MEASLIDWITHQPFCGARVNISYAKRRMGDPELARAPLNRQVFRKKFVSRRIEQYLCRMGLRL